MNKYFWILALALLGGCNKPTGIIQGPGSTNGSGGSGGSGGNGGGGTSNSKPPVAMAGPDQTITILTQNISAELNGTLSYDSSGVPLKFLWRQLSGPADSRLISPEESVCTVYDLNRPGTYSYELKAWNNRGAGLDTVNLHVVFPANCQANRPEVPVSLTFLSDLPEQIQNPEVYAAGNKLIIPAWFNYATGTISGTVYLYDRVTRTWTTLRTSQARLGVSTVVAGNKVFFAGGVDDWDYVTRTEAVVDIYDLSTNSWSTAQLSEGRGYCMAVASGSKVFFAGGLREQNTLSNKVDVYDMESNSWSYTTLPGGARAAGAAVTAGNKVLFCGGYVAYENPTGFGNVFASPSNVIDVFHTGTGQWSSATMQQVKGSFAAVCTGDTLFLAGGTIRDAASFHVEKLNVNSLTGTSSCLNQPRIFYGGKDAVVKNNLVLFFNNSMVQGVDNDRFEIYNTQTGQWSVGVLPPGTVKQDYLTAITSVNNEIYTIVNNKLYKMNL